MLPNLSDNISYSSGLYFSLSQQWNFNIICIIHMLMLWNFTPLKIQFKIHQNSNRYGNLSFAQQNKFILIIYQKKNKKMKNDQHCIRVN